MEISLEISQKIKQAVFSLVEDRKRWEPHWEDLARMYLPRRYTWLTTAKVTNGLERNNRILNPTGTFAARTLASGMNNGITSPARPWLNLGATGLKLSDHPELAVHLQEEEEILYSIFADSNFYNSIAVVYLDIVIFGTAAMLIYEDNISTIRCYNSPLGEFYVAQSNRLQVNLFARKFMRTVTQIVEQWGIENVSENIKRAYTAHKGSQNTSYKIVHLIEPNKTGDGLVPKSFKFREIYYEEGAKSGLILSAKGFNELPGIFPRWETIGNESYGSSPGMDNYPDVVQLQAETKNKAQGLDKMIRPPMVADIQLQNKPTALVPNGITFVSGINSIGMKPIHELRLPVAEISQDIKTIELRIKQGFHNDLFRLISELDTVRSATEIDGIKEEKLVLLGPVLQRFETEALDVAVKRIRNIAKRRGIIPELPEQYRNVEIEISYNSILSVAQKAFNAIPTERFLQLVGQVVPLYPAALNVPNIDNILRNYGNSIGIAADELNTRDETEAANQQNQELTDLRETAATGGDLVNSAQQLSQTEVGGGANALELLLGGG